MISSARASKVARNRNAESLRGLQIDDQFQSMNVSHCDRHRERSRRSLQLLPLRCAGL